MAATTTTRKTDNGQSQDTQRQFENVQDQARQQYAVTQELTANSLRTWNQMVAAGADYAFDSVLRNWNYTKSLRDASEQALEETVQRQRETTAQMLEVWQGYSNSVADTLSKTGK